MARDEGLGLRINRSRDKGLGHRVWGLGFEV